MSILARFRGVVNSFATLALGFLDTDFLTNTGAGPNNESESVALQTDSKILMSGTFTSFNGTSVKRIVRLNSDGSLDTAFTTNGGTGANNGILSIAVQSDGKILVAGFFTFFNGTAASALARLNSDGTLDTAFATTIGTGITANTNVESVVVQSDGKILLGGFFSVFNGTTSNRIARLNTDGTLDTTFTTNIGTGADSSVYSIAVQSDGKILLGGNFSDFNGTSVNRIARLNTDGTLDTAFTPSVSSSVWGIVVQSDGKILLGGSFTTVNGTTSNRIARLNTDGTLDTTFTTNIGTGANSRVIPTAVQSDGKILLGGDFTTFNGTNANRIARLNTDGTLDTTFTTNIGTGLESSTVQSIALQPDGKILLGGGFTTFNGTTVNRIARLI